ncbi:hypothetical protein ABMA10_04115 [Plantibacter sp. RU18]
MDEVRPWWPVPAEFPNGADDWDQWVIVIDGDVVGYAQTGEEAWPDIRHGSIDLFLDPKIHGQGIGSAVVSALSAHLFESEGHHRIVIEPARENPAAVAAYAKVGYRTVGVQHEAWRDETGTWRDNVLMELLSRDLITLD